MINQLITVSEGRLAQATVLIADDEPMNLALVESILGDCYQVIAVENGEEAIQRTLAQMPDLLLLDVAMGALSGIDVCRQLKSNSATENIPVLFLTGLGKPEDELACWEAGAVDFIPKPVSPQTLLNRVKVHLKLKFQSDLMQQLAFVDGLTGVFNRRYIDNQLEVGLRQRSRNASAFSFLMIDVDYFKNYNDLEGHQAGDECLKSLARIWRGTRREMNALSLWRES